LTAAINGLAVVAVLAVACGSPAGRQEEPTPTTAKQPIFAMCRGATPAYVLVDVPPSGCRQLEAGTDYADGRVLIGLRPGATDEDVAPDLARYHATVISSGPAAGQRVLAVPGGTVPQAVVGLERSPAVAYAQPDLLEHVDQST